MKAEITIRLTDENNMEIRRHGDEITIYGLIEFALLSSRLRMTRVYKESEDFTSIKIPNEDLPDE